jgi:AsmA-like C-terminal region
MSTTRSPRVSNPFDSVSESELRDSSLSMVKGGKNFKARLITGAVVMLVLLAITGFLFLSHHAFSREAVIQDLEEATGTQVRIKDFRGIYFPHPGCELAGVTFVQNRGRNSPPLLTMQKLTVAGSYLGLLAHRVSVIRAEGMHVLVPPLGTGTSLNRKKSNTVIGQFITDNAVLEFARSDPAKPSLKFQVHRFVIHDLASDRAMAFETALSNPEPPGEIRASGKLGPWRDDNAGQTPVEGEYNFERADLGSLGGIAGLLSSQGKFHGTFKQLSVEGETDMPAFEVKRSQHPTHLATNFHALVDATNGDVTLRDVNAQFWNTKLQAHGTVDGKHGGNGKTAQLEIIGHEGRIENLMMLFIREKRSPIAGVVSFGARTTIPPKDGPFLKKVELEGDFGIDAARFSNPETQRSMTELSEKARGEADKLEDGNLPPERVVSDLKGHVLLKNGTATFSRLTFTVPGATAEMHGTYDLISQRVNLSGTLHMVAKLSQATTGVKSFLIKLINPFIKKDKPNQPISFRITGTYNKPDYSVSP